MYGAILGDIAGSRFEFDRGGWTKDFEFITDEDKWTDDSVMTVAIAEALLEAGKDATIPEIEEACTKAIAEVGTEISLCWIRSTFYRMGCGKGAQTIRKLWKRIGYESVCCRLAI